MKRTDIIYIYLHGFNSSKESKTGQALKNILKNGEVILAEYDYTNAEKALEVLEPLVVEQFKRPQEVVLIGNSLGGFFANYLAEEYGLDCFLINPVIDPTISLKRHIGLIKNHHNGKEYNFTESNIDTYRKLKIREKLNSPKAVFLSKNDEVLDYKVALKYFEKYNPVVDEKETHRIKNYEYIGRLIKEFGNGICD